MEKFDLESLVRPNIRALDPYSSARDEFTGDEGIFLDANENPFGQRNRYPDPHQRLLKKALSERKQIPVENIFIGNGSDEAIDLVYRIFCEPRQDRVIICPPTYGMYEVSANINNVEVLRVPLTDQFKLDIDKILSLQARCIFVCSPNNPTGNSLQNVERLLQEFRGIVVVDEAYIDFSGGNSFLEKLPDYPNLIVMQTFSKAWGLAGARVGVAYASAEIISLMDKTKPPYNVSSLNQAEALRALSNPLEFERQLSIILEQRALLEKELKGLSVVHHVYPSDANFLLVEVTEANEIYRYLVGKKVIVRNRSAVIRNCLRITVGTPEENRMLISELKNYN
ncbi:histidinol-phosphate transaminase [Proteiniphilum sp. X52]|uniref:histidinol-phosphate transaminase n=1 Tax=Proteiniphilum sp. X52 TaxID=2382159 RepID=UPI000F0A0D57|nr:histidinol-phosphate transaminase [Proteiniphilum sp. X52]RNC63730.1 histidinol-phosphate transaminase [Proteiniphilum sp. X52]